MKIFALYFPNVEEQPLRRVCTVAGASNTLTSGGHDIQAFGFATWLANSHAGSEIAAKGGSRA